MFVARPPRLLWPMLAVVLILSPLLIQGSTARAETLDPPGMAPVARGVNADFFGVVGRDPIWEWNTDPQHPNDLNRVALEAMAADLALVGAGWIRIELRATHDDPKQGGPGYIDYRKWDWFIKECAPKYRLKVLLLLGSALLQSNAVDPSVSFTRINDPPDRPDGTNNYTRLFAERTKEVVDHFGDSVAAYEILNEPNSNDILYRESQGTQAELNPEIYGALLAKIYQSVKPAHPNVQLLVGGLIYGKRVAGTSADFDYLYIFYRTEQLTAFYAANGRYPFDGVAVHAYFIDQPRDVVNHLTLLRYLANEAHDPSPLWLTEIGVPATPARMNRAFLVANQTKDEQAQAAFARELFSLLLNEARPFVAHAFWFKYEDFPFGNGWAEYGLVRLPITATGAYMPPPAPRKPIFAAIQSVANPAAAPTAPESPDTLPTGAYYFPQTRHAMSGAFRTYWEENGGLARFGFPLTRVFEVGGIRVQYFERARFEWHPENDDANKVQLGLLTAFLTQGRDFPKGTPPSPCSSPTPSAGPSPGGTPTVPAPTPSCGPPIHYFAETGHTLRGAFLDYWRSHGDLPSLGYPISEELREVNEADGRTYTVQYFERARLEYHPENAGSPYAVLLGLMGLETLNTGGWYR